MVPVIAFVGRHNAGKTTLLSNLISRLQQKGIECAVVKNSHHLLTPDNSDSGQLYAAGAQQVYLSTPQETLIYRREEKLSLERSWNKSCLQWMLFSWKDSNNRFIQK